MGRQVNMHEAKTHFSKLAEAVEAGEEVIIARAGKPFMKLVLIEEPRKPINFGFAAEELAAWKDVDWAQLDKEFNQLFRDYP
jgi:prevent-host-death family protein